MPHRARIDAPGALQHIICRGIQRCRIYRDDSDRQDFLSRLDKILRETRTTGLESGLLRHNQQQSPFTRATGHGVWLNRESERIPRR